MTNFNAMVVISKGIRFTVLQLRFDRLEPISEAPLLMMPTNHALIESEPSKLPPIWNLLNHFWAFRNHINVVIYLIGRSSSTLQNFTCNSNS